MALGTDGNLSIDKFIDKVYLNNFTTGYYAGLTLANRYGFTTQNPAIIDLCSNKASTKQRKVNVDGYVIVVYKPMEKITNDNLSSLQFLDLMTNIDKYSELNGDELKEKLENFIKATKVNFEYVKKYISKYPLSVYENIHEKGLMNKLMRSYQWVTSTTFLYVQKNKQIDFLNLVVKPTV